MADVTEILKGGFTLLCGNWIQDRTKPNPKNWKLISKVKDFARDDVSKIQDGFAQLSLERARENLNSAHDLVQKRYEEKGKGKSWSTDPALVTQLQNYYRAAKDAALEHFGYDTTITHRATRIEALQIAMYGEAYGLFVTNQCLGDGVGVEKYLKLIFSDKDLCQALTCVFDRTAETTEIRGDEVIHLIKVLQTLSKQEINEEVIKNSGLISGDSRNYPKKLWERVRNSKLESLIDIGFTTIVDQLRQLYKSKYMKVSPLSFLLPHEFHMDKMWAPLTLRKGGKDNKDYVNGTEAYDKTIKLALKKNRLTIVTGKPYFGKTTLVQKIAYDWAMEKDKDYDLVLVAPIRDVPESKKERPYTKILNMVIAYIEVISGCNFDYLLRMDISNRKLLVILDGYDEERSGHKCSELHNLLQSSDENAPDQLKFDVLITRRPSKAIRRDKKVSFLSITGFHTDELREEFITRYVETIGQDDVSKVMKTIKDMKLDHDLIESPMMLTLICLLHDKLKTGSVSELLDLSIQLLIERWVEKDDENFKMNLLVYCVLLSVIGYAFAPPPKRPPPAEKAPEHPKNPNDDDSMYEFAYSRYLEEVVKVLESDPKFQEKLRGMPEDDIKAGKIAEHVDELGPGIMDQLTQAKLKEIERLRMAIQKQIEVEGGAHNVKMPEHLDAANWEKFGKDDLKKLIKQTVIDMEELDKKRKEKFKEYEMKKEAEREHKLAQMDAEARAKAEKEHAESLKRHDEHEKVKHPGSRDQLEEVWEDSDKMDKDNFDPRTFFALHDLNGDGMWSIEELEALFQIELDKVYNDTNPDDDPKERIEEMNRMREHVVGQMDKNNDRMISLQEFLQDNEAQADNVDPGWKDLSDEQVYTEEELKRFEDEYAKQQAQQVYPGGQPQQYQQGQVPQQQYQQVPVQQQGQVPVQQQQYQQVPVQQQGQVPQQQQYQQVPVQQQQYQQVPVQQQQQGVPVQQQQYQQVPVQQQQPAQGQVPQQQAVPVGQGQAHPAGVDQTYGV
uniref:NACHT domain-containing protein n=1 Tax=Plectus sambesii TaxID=2011161 RepID=A0A914WA46_9BILA